MMRSGLFVVALATSGSFIEGDEALKLSLRSVGVVQSKDRIQSKDRFLQELSKKDAADPLQAAKELYAAEQDAAMKKIRLFFVELENCDNDVCLKKHETVVFKELIQEIRATTTRISDWSSVVYISDLTVFSIVEDYDDNAAETAFKERKQEKIQKLANILVDKICSRKTVAEFRAKIDASWVDLRAQKQSGHGESDHSQEDAGHDSPKIVEHVNVEKQIQMQEKEKASKHADKTEKQLEEERPKKME